MQIRKLARQVLFAGRISKSGTSRPGTMVGRVSQNLKLVFLS